MKFERIYKNITGLSCPIFGISWQPPIIEVDEAHKLIVFLQDKRVLFNPMEMEAEQHCVMSVIAIRDELTQTLQSLPRKSLIAKSVTRMRKACHDFSNVLGHPNFNTLDDQVRVSILMRQLIKLREKFGVSVAELAVAHGLDVEDDLANIIPFNSQLS